MYVPKICIVINTCMWFGRYLFQNATEFINTFIQGDFVTLMIYFLTFNQVLISVVTFLNMYANKRHLLRSYLRVR